MMKTRSKTTLDGNGEHRNRFTRIEARIKGWLGWATAAIFLTDMFID